MASLRERVKESLNKIKISQLTENDRNEVFDLLQDSETMKFLGPRRPLTDEESEEWFINELKSESRFVFRFVETNEVVGFCGLMLIDGELDFSYFIRRKFWGFGFATLMCKEVICKLSPTIDLSKVKVFIASNNIGSQKVAQKLGWIRKCKFNNEFESGFLYQIHT